MPQVGLASPRSISDSVFGVMPAWGAKAANLRKARHCAGLSQEEVGWLASLHRTEIGLLETGARTPRIDTLVKIAAAVDVPVECPLLDGITWNPGSTRAGAFSLVAQTSAPQERDELEGD